MASYNTKLSVRPRETPSFNMLQCANLIFPNVLIGKSEFDSEYKRRRNPLILVYLHCWENKHTNDASHENEFVLGKGEWNLKFCLFTPWFDFQFLLINSYFLIFQQI